MRVEIDGKARSLRWGGFTSPRNLSRHFMTHVARVNRACADEQRDPERWSDVWPPGAALAGPLGERRRQVRARLRALQPPCDLAASAPARRDVCAGCEADRGVISAVQVAFEQELRAYEAVTHEAVRSCLAGETDARSTFYVTRDTQPLEDLEPWPDGTVGIPGSDTLVVYAISGARVQVKAMLWRDDEVQAVTCYRPCRGDQLVPLSRARFDFEMRRRAALSSGVLVASAPVAG